MSSSSSHPLLGRVLQGRHQLVSFIKEGGMAQVFCATQDADPPHVAVKILDPELADDQEVVKRFLREGRVASRLSHPNIVRVLGVDEDRDLLFMVMELLFGDDLSARVKAGGAFTEARITEIMIDVFSALHYAHESGVVHRDIKPENVMLCRQPNAPTDEIVKVLDFGIAKILDATPSVPLPESAPTGVRSVLTHVGLCVGTPAYMSPEQGRAEEVDHRTDLYSAGVLLYELLTGRLPFMGETPLQIVARHVRDPVPKPSSFQQIHPGLEDLLLRLLAKEPDRRPATAHLVSQELSFLLGDLADDTSRRWFASIGPPATPSDESVGSFDHAESEPFPIEPASPQAPSIEVHDTTHQLAVEPTQADVQVEATTRVPRDQVNRTLVMEAERGLLVLGRGAEQERRRSVAQHPLLRRVLAGTYELAAVVREDGPYQVFAARIIGQSGATAVKLLRPELAAMTSVSTRFFREAELAAKLVHPSIVRSSSARETDGLLYFTRDLLYGDDLSARVRQPGALSQLRAIEVGVEVCRALGHAHSLGVIHGNLRPESVFLCRAPETPQIEQVKVADFASIPRSDEITSIFTDDPTHDAASMYRAPELEQGQAGDERSDLYALGVLLVHVLTGHAPLPWDPAQDKSAHEPDGWLAAIPAPLRRVLLGAITRSPQRRFASAAEMLAGLIAAQAQLSSPGTSEGAARWLRRGTPLDVGRTGTPARGSSGPARRVPTSVPASEPPKPSTPASEPPKATPSETPGAPPASAVAERPREVPDLSRLIRATQVLLVLVSASVAVIVVLAVALLVR